MKRILALPVLCLAIVLVPYFFSCDPYGGDPSVTASPTSTGTPTSQLCQPIVCPDPGDMTFSGDYVIGTTMLDAFATVTTENQCGAPADATVEFSGAEGWWSVPAQSTIEPGGATTWEFHRDWDAVIAPGAIDSTVEITATDGTHTGVCSYNLHVDVTEPQPLHIKVTDIAAEWQIGTDCSEPIGSGTVTNNTAGGAEGWTTFTNPDLFFADPPVSQVPAGQTQEFFVFVDCLMLDEPGTHTSEFTLSADCAEGATSETAQILFEVLFGG